MLNPVVFNASLFFLKGEERSEKTKPSRDSLTSQLRGPYFKDHKAHRTSNGFLEVSGCCTKLILHKKLIFQWQCSIKQYLIHTLSEPAYKVQD